MNFLNIILEEFYEHSKQLDIEEEVMQGYGVEITPIVSYFCFNSPLDLLYEKQTVNEESDFPDKQIKKEVKRKVKQEKKASKKGKTSKETGTIYKFTSEQKRALKYLKKKYGRRLIKDIRTFRNNFIAPYQIIKSNMEKSKALYPKQVFGMNKEEYLRLKRSAEKKIENMRVNRYADLNKEYLSISDKAKATDDLSGISSSKEINARALKAVFDKYNIRSNRYSDSDFETLLARTENAVEYLDDFVNNISQNTGKEKSKELKNTVDSIIQLHREMKSGRSFTTQSVKKMQSSLNSAKNTIEDLDADDDEKEEAMNAIEKASTINGDSIGSGSFADEFAMYSLRKRVIDSINNQNDDKYYEAYKSELGQVKKHFGERKQDILSRMAKERVGRKLTDEEKKIYELKPGKPKDSDNINDYILKIHEADFFNPMFFEKSEEMKQAERKIDAEIKRFERSLQSKIEEKDFKLLKKYRLINNPITVKTLKSPIDMFKSKDEEEDDII